MSLLSYLQLARLSALLNLQGPSGEFLGFAKPLDSKIATGHTWPNSVHKAVRQEPQFAGSAKPSKYFFSEGVRAAAHRQEQTRSHWAGAGFLSASKPPAPRKPNSLVNDCIGTSSRVPAGDKSCLSQENPKPWHSI